jgi:hypothetical protein
MLRGVEGSLHFAQRSGRVQIQRRHPEARAFRSPKDLCIYCPLTRTTCTIRHSRGAPMLRIILLLIAVVALVLFVPRLLSRTATPAVGSDAPQFTLPSQDGTPVSLKDYRGKWVVLYFYPKDETPG